MDALAEAADALTYQLGNVNFDSATNGERRVVDSRCSERVAVTGGAERNVGTNDRGRL